MLKVFQPVRTEAAGKEPGMGATKPLFYVVKKSCNEHPPSQYRSSSTYCGVTFRQTHNILKIKSKMNLIHPVYELNTPE